ncbi:MAG: hypothetical protein H7343_18230 [Undibacterium sp.]|nr:hypothetical protein [Opitutaceae bacterium]
MNPATQVAPSVISLVPGYLPGFLERHMRAYAQRHLWPEEIDRDEACFGYGGAELEVTSVAPTK